MKKPLEIVDLVTFTEQLLNEKIHFLCTKFIWLGSNIVDIKVIWFEHLLGVKKCSYQFFIERSDICGIIPITLREAIWHIIKCRNLLKLGFTEGTLSGVRQFLATESTLSMMENAFYFTSKALFVLKIFKLLSWLFGHVSKWLD